MIVAALALLTWSILRRPGPEFVEASDPRVLAVREALSAWGQFAVSGDLGSLAGYFDPAGPQYRQLASESVRLRAAPLGGPAYEFLLAEEEVSGDVVDGRVTVRRPGEPDQVFRWSIELRRSGGRWLVWTVSNLEP
jgi:hypothetical protein